MRAAVVGLGRFGLVHLNIYRRMVARGSLTGVVVYDVDRHRVEHALDAPDVEAFDPNRIPNDVCVASVCVPPAQHAVAAKPLLDHGLDILVEKPLTMDPDTSRGLVGDAMTSQGRLWVGHSERFNPAFHALRTARVAWRHVSVWRMGVRRPAGVDVVFDLMIHDLDMLYVVCGGDVVEVDALGVTRAGHLERVQARVRLSNGVRAVLQAGYGARRTLRGWSLEDRSGHVTRVNLCAPHVSGVGPVDLELEALVARSRGVTTPGRWGLATGDEGARAVQLAQRIIDATRTVSESDFIIQSVGPSY